MELLCNSRTCLVFHTITDRKGLVCIYFFRIEKKNGSAYFSFQLHIKSWQYGSWPSLTQCNNKPTVGSGQYSHPELSWIFLWASSAERHCGPRESICPSSRTSKFPSRPQCFLVLPVGGPLLSEFRIQQRNPSSCPLASVLILASLPSVTEPLSEFLICHFPDNPTHPHTPTPHSFSPPVLVWLTHYPPPASHMDLFCNCKSFFHLDSFLSGTNNLDIF